MQVRLNAREHAFFLEQVKKSGLTREAYLRRLIQGKPVKARPPSDYLPVLRELSAIGNNINQIARAANTTHMATQKQLEEVHALVERMWEHLRALR